ncbi:hypothetical protein L5515_019587 [Caenorhabditis briggsae]|uniref:Uncharacterized protein n=1 Tax=Caenorhabditis briggsae TaxID=6238 RepID=A0AAE9FM88_CAEBR|nr:hypothetical protein L5515_019587 [Caenorhabditis briggsae]
MYDLFIKTVHDLISSYKPLFVSSPPKSSSSNLLRRLRRIRGAAAKILKSNQYHSPRLSRLLSKQKALFKLHQKSTSAFERLVLTNHNSRATKTLVRRRLKANPSSHPITTCLEKIEMMKGLGVLKGLDIEEQLEHCGIVNAQIKTFGRVSRLMNNHAIFAESSSNLAHSIRRDYEENQKNVWRIVVLFDDLRVKDHENPGNVAPAVNAELPIRASNSEFSNVPKTSILRNSSENSHEMTAFNFAAHNLDAGPSSQHGRDVSRRRQKRSVTFL